MKKFEKLIPVAAAVLMAASAGSVEAQAADEFDTTADTKPAAPAQDEQKETGDRSPEIGAVVPTPGPENLGQDQLLVNPDTDEAGNVTVDGTLDVTTTPGEPTTSEETNPDGSTTTTVTETSKEEIEGEIEGEPVEPSDEEKEEIKGDIEEELEDSKTESEDGKNDYDWGKFEESIKDKYEDAIVTEGEDTDGNKTHTVKFETTSEEDRPLADSELAVVLGVDPDKLTKNEDGSYTYTNASGATVTVSVKDESTETTTTKWTVTITEKTETMNGSTGDVEIDSGIKDTTDTPIVADESVKNILKEAEAAEEGAVKTNESGQIVEYKKGNDTYTFRYETKTETIAVEKLSDDVLEELGLTMTEGKIFDAVGHELKFDENAKTLTKTTTTVTMSKSTYTPPTGEEIAEKQEEVNEEAKKQAAVDALKEAISKRNPGSLSEDKLSAIKQAVDAAVKKGDIWDVVVDEILYTVTVTLKTPAAGSGETTEILDEDAPLVGLPGDVTVSAEAEAAIVVKETVEKELTEAESSGKVDSIEGISKDEVANVTKGGIFRGGEVTGLTETDGKVTSITTIKTENGVTTETTYNFTYKVNNDWGGTEKEDTDGDYSEIKKDDIDKDLVMNIVGDDFFIKQANGGIIWVKDGDKRLDEEIIEEASTNKNYGGKGGIDKYIVIRGNNVEHFCLDKYFAGNQYDHTWITVENGILTIKGDISHVNMQHGDYGAVEFGGSYTWNATGKKQVEEEVTYTGQGKDQKIVHGTVSEKAEVGTGESVKYGGELKYTYDVKTGEIVIDVTGERVPVRHVDVVLDVTEETTTTTPSPTPTTPPTTPTTPPTPPTTPTPPPTTPTTPTEPEIEIPEEEPPLAETPEEPGAPEVTNPAAEVEIPDEEVPLVETPEQEIPDEEVPLTELPNEEIPDEAVPLAELPDEEVPLANVPKTGENRMLELMSAAAVAVSALWLAVTKKRKDV